MTKLQLCNRGAEVPTCSLEREAGTFDMALPSDRWVTSFHYNGTMMAMAMRLQLKQQDVRLSICLPTRRISIGLKNAVVADVGDTYGHVK